MTGSFEKAADQVSFRATDDRWLDLLRLSASSPEVTISSPLTAHDLGEKAGAIALLAKHLETQGDSNANSEPLRQLLDALQLEPLTDDAYRRLWFLQLHDRCRRLLHSSGRKIHEEKAFEKVNSHRNEIAHEGVERMDLQLMKQLQQNAHEVIVGIASSDAKRRPTCWASVAGRSSPALLTRRWSSKAIWMRSGCSSGSICWVLLVSGRFPFSKTIIPDAKEHFLTPSPRRDAHLFGGLGLRAAIA